MKTKTAEDLRLPAEWEPHNTWIIWPHNITDWPRKFGPIPYITADLLYHLTRQEFVHVVCKDKRVLNQVFRLAKFYHVDLTNMHVSVKDSDRSWARDSAPVFVRRGDKVESVQFAFDGWQKYPNWEKDRGMAEHTAKKSRMPTTRAFRPDTGEPMVLEGGAIDSNGAGTLLVTESVCVAGKQKRNKGMTASDYELAFYTCLGIRQTIWLGEGAEGDDTGGHIDDICRFVDKTTVVLMYEDDPADPRHAVSKDNLKRLRLAAKRLKYPLAVVKLPYPARRVYDEKKSQVVPASYANFYIARKEVLLPTFNDPNDIVALNILRRLFRWRRAIRGMYAGDFIWGLGSWHCFTQPQWV